MVMYRCEVLATLQDCMKQLLNFLEKFINHDFIYFSAKGV
jgi:hypothetical protein